MNKDFWPIIGAVILLLGSMFVIWKFKQAGYTLIGSIEPTPSASPSATIMPTK